MPVDGDEDGKLLAMALQEHEENETVCDLLSPVVFSDDRIGRKNLSVDSFSQKAYKDEIEASGVAMLTLASWYDTGASDAHFVRMRDFSNDQKIFLTGGQHGARFHASPYVVDDEAVPPIPSGKVTWGKAIDFFDYYLKDKANGYEQWPAVSYWNLGEEVFQSSGPWPVEGTEYLRFYFAEDNTLTPHKPSLSVGSDEYAVDFETTTGLDSRWWTGIGKPMLGLSDRRSADEKMLVYTSEPLSEDLQVTGWPIVSLNVSSTHTDGAFIAYLEDVDETGKSIYVNEGGLRALHRKTSENPVAGLPVPYHSFAAVDAAPLVPGEIAKLDFEMIPTSVLIRKGHRLRIAIAGADRDNFVRIPERGDPVISVYRGGDHASYIALPVLPD
jgi:putative CocE/NonD family hydrolase